MENQASRAADGNLCPESAGRAASGRPRGARRLHPFARAIVLASLAFTGGALTSELGHATTDAESPYHLTEQLGRVLVAIENDYVDPVDRSRMLEGAIKGMVAELDPHSSYLPPADYTIFQGDLEGKFGGIGVEVDFATDYVTVIAPIEGSPAEQAGIRSGDRILAIDNQIVRGRSPSDLVRAMRGEPGTKVIINLKREGVDRILTFVLTRRTITVASLASKLLDEKVAYLRIKSFQNGTHSEFLRHVAELRGRAQGALRGVVLDLRNNPGGSVNEASAIADEFLSGGVIFTTRRRGKVIDEERADRAGALRREHAVVLVNEYSASASELVAGALRDNQRAKLVGATTFGKGSVQLIVDLPGGAGLRLTALRYYTPSGRAIQAQGVTPDLIAGAAPGGYGIVREEHLENHLPADEGAVAETPAPITEDPAGREPMTTDSIDHGVAREVPSDPRKGPDEALKAAYELLLSETGTTK